MSARLVIATALPGVGGGLASAAALATAAGALDRVRERGGVVIVDLEGERKRGPTVLASASARRLEQRYREAGLAGAARGSVCWVSPPAEDGAATAIRAVVRAGAEDAGAIIAWIPAVDWRLVLEDERLRVLGGLIRAELPAQRHLAALAARELAAAGARAKVVGHAPGAVASRRAIAGLDPGGAAGARAARFARGLFGPRPARPVVAIGERGQALPLVLGAMLVTVLCALLLVAIGGAVTGKARAQRAADLAAVSAARSMRDDYGRLFAPARLASGAPNPRHLDRGTYLAHAAAAAREAARRNGADPDRLRITFPDRHSFAPLRARVALRAELVLAPNRSGDEEGPPPEVEAEAEAALAPPPEAADAGTDRLDPPSGDEYAGPLAYRQGKPMRPDVAATFDRLAAAARSAGHVLVISSAYRSNAEQAELFARNPDPRWVAPPGRSLHRCATELDLGPASAYAWLDANARRFGFHKRYHWEPWHYGYVRGPAPCSAAGNRDGRPGGGPADGRAFRGGGLPAFVPVRFRDPIRSAAARHDVSAALLSAQLLAESNFNPFAVSPAGARGIAQFMPATAAAYSLRDPFEPRAAIEAQARLMSDLLGQFGSVALALAAYNAGPAPVAACSCVPDYPETQAYVARILGLLDGAGELVAPPLEVRLVA